MWWYILVCCRMWCDVATSSGLAQQCDVMWWYIPVWQAQNVLWCGAECDVMWWPVLLWCKIWHDVGRCFRFVVIVVLLTQFLIQLCVKYDVWLKSRKHDSGWCHFVPSDVSDVTKQGRNLSGNNGYVVVAVVPQLHTFSHQSNFSDEGDNEVILNVNVAKMSSTSWANLFLLFISNWRVQMRNWLKTECFFCM